MKISEYLYKIILSNVFFTIYFIFAGILIISLAYSSLSWGFGLDNQPLIYLAYLTDKFNFLPYRDFFYYQMPGVHFYYVLIGFVFGFSYISLRIADLILLGVTLTLSFFLFKQINWKTGVCGTALFGLYYLFGGDYFSLQREFVLFIPILSAVLFITSVRKKTDNLKFFVIGFCCSISTCIKPHAIIVFPVLILFQLLSHKENYFNPFSWKNTIFSLLISIAGFLIPVTAITFYLWKTNSLIAFWDITTNFLPLYRQLTYFGDTLFALLPDSSRSAYSINKILHFGNQRLLFLPASLGIYISIFRSNLAAEQKRLIYLFAALSLIFCIYVSLAGMYFSYHWIPFSYCMIFLSSLCFIKTQKLSKYSKHINVLLLIIIYSVFSIRVIQQTDLIYELLTGKQSVYVKSTNIVEASQYLKQNMNPGEKVLPLDGQGTALAAMLLARVPPATYYITAWFFNIPELSKNEYITKVRLDYITQLKQAKPKYILDFYRKKWFVELQTIIDNEYVKNTFNGYIIYTRK